MAFQIQEDLVKMLVYATEKYRLEDKSKALRCILYFTVKDGDRDEIFDKARCNRRVYFFEGVQYLYL